jgi:hypothetical protein
MPSNPPLTSSGRREPIRVRSLPPKVKAALLYLVHGRSPISSRVGSLARK